MMSIAGCLKLGNFDRLAGRPQSPEDLDTDRRGSNNHTVGGHRYWTLYRPPISDIELFSPISDHSNIGLYAFSQYQISLISNIQNSRRVPHLLFRKGVFGVR
jgi:hypothetical protein